MKAFLAYPVREIRQNLDQKGNAVKAPMFVVYLLLYMEHQDIRLMRGSGLFISGLGVWRCPSNNKLTMSRAFS